MYQKSSTKPSRTW